MEAGKTYLTGNIIERMRRTAQCALFAFISHERLSAGKILNVLHSLLFQALDEVPSLRPILPNSWDPNLQDQSFVKDLLCKVLASIGPAFILLDGLDEIEKVDWEGLLSTILDIQKNCVETKVFVSSREERRISRALEKHAVTLRMVKNNLEDIRAFVHERSHDLLLEVERCGASKKELSGIRDALTSIAEKSDGMLHHPLAAVLGISLTRPEACFCTRNS
jgi:hypothetical protein